MAAMAYEGAKTGQAKALRSRMTSAERKLWSHLRAHRFHGLLWRRQEPFGRFIVDFYCPVVRVFIELDGDAHGFTTKADTLRQAWLEDQGVTVIRFPNWLVLTDIHSVLEGIFRKCEGHLPAEKQSNVDLDEPAYPYPPVRKLTELANRGIGIIWICSSLLLHPKHAKARGLGRGVKGCFDS